MDGGNAAEGRVEVCYNNEWGAVCDDGWGTVDAEVTCSQAGFIAQGLIENEMKLNMCTSILRVILSMLNVIVQELLHLVLHSLVRVVV